jgi:protoheme IX farnesyltransferase
LITTLAGFYLASNDSLDLVLLINTLLGTAFVSGGGGVLNQWMERDVDALMRRTQNRPIPMGRVHHSEALIFGSILTVGGIFYLAVAVNVLTSLLAILTIFGYLFVYTPLKKKTWLSTIVGAFPGAVPPIMGWTAVKNEITVEAWALFSILFFWQIPHFLSIAWMYRSDYARAGFPMLPVIDHSGKSSARQIILYCIALIPASLAPTFLGLTGSIYFFGTLLIGIVFLFFGICVAIFKSNLYAKRLLYASIFYIPIILIFMIIDKTKI